jgi:hypothetical protein
MTTELKGVIPITATPFDGAGQVDEASIATLVEFEARCGVHGLNEGGDRGAAAAIFDRYASYIRYEGSRDRPRAPEGGPSPPRRHRNERGAPAGTRPRRIFLGIVGTRRRNEQTVPPRMESPRFRGGADVLGEWKREDFLAQRTRPARKEFFPANCCKLDHQTDGGCTRYVNCRSHTLRRTSMFD